MRIETAGSPPFLQVERIGPQHQAGSDSLLTGRAFFKMQEIYFEDELDDSKVGKFGLNYLHFRSGCNCQWIHSWSSHIRKRAKKEVIFIANPMGFYHVSKLCC